VTSLPRRCHRAPVADVPAADAAAVRVTGAPRAPGRALPDRRNGAPHHRYAAPVDG